MAEMFATATGTTETHVTPEFAASVADSLINALQLARPIVAAAPAPPPHFAAAIQATILAQLDESLVRAQAAFPGASSFQGPGG
jgi:hypothetical protein